MDANHPYDSQPDRFPTDSITGLSADGDQPPAKSTAVFSQQDASRALRHVPAGIQENPPRPVTVFVRLPANPTHVDEALARTPWRIKLTSPHHLPEPPALELLGDVFVGRIAGGIQPDLDLTPYAGADLGVSRLHALLRPTRTHLLIHDLGSTNGTFLSSRRITPGAAAEISNGDFISFGRLQFLVTILEHP